MSKGASTSKQELPEWQRQQAQEVFQAGKQLAGTPFVPYTGPRVAGFNPDQLRQFQATRGLFESGMQYDPLSGLQELAQAPTPTIQPVTIIQSITTQVDRQYLTQYKFSIQLSCLIYQTQKHSQLHGFYLLFYFGEL